jgi:uncharacterized protein
VDSALATSDAVEKPGTGSAGVGLRLPHLTEVAMRPPAVGWLEIHPENFLANPHARELLLGIARSVPVSIHTVGLSIGSVEGVDGEHLARIQRLVDDLDPCLVSGHLAWSTHGGRYLNDLLPLPYDEESLRLISANLDRVQEALGRRYLVENPASYVGFAGSSLEEVQFLEELARRTGCGLLCDISNVFVSAANMGFDAYAYIDAFPAQAVDELHLGGFTPEPDCATPGEELLIDTHARPIASPVWDLYAHALRRFGPRPTLIEWDNDLPPLAVLAAQAQRADAIAVNATEEGGLRAAAR